MPSSPVEILEAERERVRAFLAKRHRIRQERSKPILVKLRSWLDASLGTVPPKSLTGKANGVEPYRYLRHVFTDLPKATRRAK